MRRALCVALLLALSLPSAARDAAGAGPALRPEAWVSSDADGNETRKMGLGWDIRRRGDDHWLGAKVEHARFAGGDWSQTERRVYLRAAGGGDAWRWRFDAGSNGDALLGSASVFSRDARRKEFFLEREVLETRGGAERGDVQTFAGASIDLPLGQRWTATGLAGAQDFGRGGNLRSHLRGNLVFAALPEQGISLQLRGRYFRNSEPFEGDYYSPRWYGEALGVVALRRKVSGHQWRAAAGIGRQRSDGEQWKRARLLEVGLDTPHWKRAWLRLNAGYKDTPVLTGGSSGSGSYAYRYVSVEAVIGL
ncbi:MAG TPA: hypothetical protein VEY92_10150 [Pseudoxanthomonas sp.]|nr:hypothetical protein [Pseudoxanthomonas sp.]